MSVESVERGPLPQPQFLPVPFVSEGVRIPVVSSVIERWKNPPTVEQLSDAKLQRLFTDAALTYVRILKWQGREPLTRSQEAKEISRAVGSLWELHTIATQPHTKTMLANFRAANKQVVIHDVKTLVSEENAFAGSEPQAHSEKIIRSHLLEAMYMAATEMTPTKQMLCDSITYIEKASAFAEVAQAYADRQPEPQMTVFGLEREFARDRSTITAAALEQVYFALQDPVRIVNPTARKEDHITAFEQIRLEHGDRLQEYTEIVHGLEEGFAQMEKDVMQRVKYSSVGDRREMAFWVKSEMKKFLREDQQTHVLGIKGFSVEERKETLKRFQQSTINLAKVTVTLEGLGFTAAGIGLLFPFLGNITEKSAALSVSLINAFYYASIAGVGLQNARMAIRKLPGLNPATQAATEGMQMFAPDKKVLALLAGTLAAYPTEWAMDLIWAMFIVGNPTSNFDGTAVGLAGSIAQMVYAQKEIMKSKSPDRDGPPLSETEKDVL